MQIDRNRLEPVETRILVESSYAPAIIPLLCTFYTNPILVLIKSL